MTFFVLSEFLYQLIHWPLCDYQYHFFGNSIYIVQHSHKWKRKTWDIIVSIPWSDLILYLVQHGLYQKLDQYVQRLLASVNCSPRQQKISIWIIIRNSLSMSATDKRSNAYTIDNTSQGIFLSNCSLYQQIWTTQCSVLR